MIGTNFWEGTYNEADVFKPDEYIEFFHGMGSRTVYAGSEHGGEANSLSVLNGSGAVSNDWSHAVVRTPGRINVGQSISGHHYFAHSYTTLIAELDGGHIVQSIGSYNRTKEKIVMYVPKGLKDGTNIVYEIDDWYEMRLSTTDEGLQQQDTFNPKTGTVNFTVAKNTSADVIFLWASTSLRSDLSSQHGITSDNSFSPAILDWLSGGKTLRYGGMSFANPGGKIYPAKFIGMDGREIRDLTLTEMYWFDIDPTLDGMVLKGGMASAPTQIVREKNFGSGDDGVEVMTNLQVGVFMMISNRLDTAYVPHAPYALRGIEPGSASIADSSSWTSVTFKVRGCLGSGNDCGASGMEWLALKNFVFDVWSFGPNFTSLIEVEDPFCESSPAYPYGWRKSANSSVLFSWRVDPDAAGNVEMLRP
jgi:hypothetical protein